jgi:hypothetical protein
VVAEHVALADVQDDLYSLDAATLEVLKPIHALIFLFKYVGGDEGQQTSGIEVDPLESGVWFANQVRVTDWTTISPQLTFR